MEINGGYQGPYKVSSSDGDELVEIDGLQAKSQGFIGGSGVGHINITSGTGDIDLSFLPSPK